MPQVENKEIVGRLLKSIIGVISRRTSDSYAFMIVKNSIDQLSEKYDFLSFINIVKNEYKESYDVVEIDDKINDLDFCIVGKATKEFVQKITNSMGKNAGYYFIREIKEDLPYDYEQRIKEAGLDLDYLQLDYITKVKQKMEHEILNSEILKYIITLIYETLERDSGRRFAYETLNELIKRLSTKHQVLNFIKVNDVSSIQDIDIVTIKKEVDEIDSSIVGEGIQKVIQDLNNQFNQKGDLNFIKKIKDHLGADYSFKLSEIGVDFNIIRLRKDLVIKHVIKSLVEILSDSSTQSYAILMVNNVIKSLKIRFGFFDYVTIDALNFSENGNGIRISSDINSIRTSELGRGIQRLIEEISVAMGEDPGMDFIDRFKRRIGKAYLLRVEEFGVNLHMIELRQNMMF